MLDMSLIKLFKNLEKSKSLDFSVIKKSLSILNYLNLQKKEFNISYLYKYFYNLSNLLGLKSLQFPKIPDLREKNILLKIDKENMQIIFLILDLIMMKMKRHINF